MFLRCVDGSEIEQQSKACSKLVERLRRSLEEEPHSPPRRSEAPVMLGSFAPPHGQCVLHRGERCKEQRRRANRCSEGRRKWRARSQRTPEGTDSAPSLTIQLQAQQQQQATVAAFVSFLFFLFLSFFAFWPQDERKANAAPCQQQTVAPRGESVRKQCSLSAAAVPSAPSVLTVRNASSRIRQLLSHSLLPSRESVMPTRWRLSHAARATAVQRRASDQIVCCSRPHGRMNEP